MPPDGSTPQAMPLGKAPAFGARGSDMVVDASDALWALRNLGHGSARLLRYDPANR